jgi:uncharacterized membrane protein YidH (DUF202 family)
VRQPIAFAAALEHHHHAPTGVLLVVLIMLALLYVALRTGRLGRLRGLSRARMPRIDPRRLGVSRFALVPLVILAIVVLLLVLGH